MNAPRADRVAAIATELGLLGRRLDALAAELSAWQPPVAPRPGGPGIDAAAAGFDRRRAPAAGVVRHRPRHTVARHARSGMAGRARRAGRTAESRWPLPGHTAAVPAGAAAPARSPPPAACLARVAVRRPAPGLDRRRRHAARRRPAAGPRRRARLVRASGAGRGGCRPRTGAGRPGRAPAPPPQLAHRSPRRHRHRDRDPLPRRRRGDRALRLPARPGRAVAGAARRRRWARAGRQVEGRAARLRCGRRGGAARAGRHCSG